MEKSKVKSQKSYIHSSGVKFYNDIPQSIHLTWKRWMISQKIYGDSRKLELLLPGFPLSDSGPEGTDDSQEPVAGDGGERHHAGHHAEDWEDGEG